MKQLDIFCDSEDTQRCGCHSHNGFLTRAGYRALDMAEQIGYLDRVSSVSGVTDDGHVSAWPTDVVVDEQYRRFHNGF